MLKRHLLVFRVRRDVARIDSLVFKLQNAVDIQSLTPRVFVRKHKNSQHAQHSLDDSPRSTYRHLLNTPEARNCGRSSLDLD